MKLRRTAVALAAAGISLAWVTPASAGAPESGTCPVIFTETEQEAIDAYIAEHFGVDRDAEGVQEMLDAAFDFVDQNGDEKVCWDQRPGKRGTIIDNRGQRP